MSLSGRSATLLVALTVGLLLTGLSAGFGEKVFNANEQTAGINYYSVTSTQRLAQSFQVAESFILYNVTLEVRNIDDRPLNVTIRPDTSGEPGTVVLAWSERTGGARAWLDFPMTPRPLLLAGRTYWILADEQPSSRTYRWYRSNGDIVPGVAKSQGSGSWSAPLSADLGYVVYGLAFEANVALGFSVDRPSVPAGGSFSYTVSMNNSGYRATPFAWVNLTLPPSIQITSDTASDLGGTLLGPGSWRFTNLGNGQHSFVVNAVLDSAAPGGSLHTTTARLVYTLSSGTPQPPQTAIATVTAALEPKWLNLAHDGTAGRADYLQAASPTNPPTGPVPDFDGDGRPGTTLTAVSADWTLNPPLFRPFRTRGSVTVALFLNGENPAGSSATLNLSVYDRRNLAETLVVSAEPTVIVDGNNFTYQLVAVDLGSTDHLFAAGNTTELRIRKVSGDDLWVGYDRTDLPSRILVTTTTYVSIDRLEVRDLRGPASTFSPQDTVRIEANVSDPFGNSEIAGVRVNITDPDGNLELAGTPFAVIASDPGGAWQRYRIDYVNPPIAGAYTLLVTATEGNGVEASLRRSFLVVHPILDLIVSRGGGPLEVGGATTITVTYRNTGTEDAPVAWLNATLPPGLAYVSDTVNGTQNGLTNWTLRDVPPGDHTFELVVEARQAPANLTFFLTIRLSYTDGKGFEWTAPEHGLGVPIRPPAKGDVLPIVLGLAVAGTFVAGFIEWRRRRPNIEEAFLIHESGILLYHISRSLGGQGEKDRDLMSAMFSAVESFVKDSFHYSERRDLNRIEFGDYNVIIERGNHVFLAVALHGRNGEDTVRRGVAKVLREVEQRYGNVLANWRGDMASILGVRDLVRRVVRSN